MQLFNSHSLSHSPLSHTNLTHNLTFLFMAPTRRPAKRGEKRMDAALDAMTPYGFPNKLVRNTVQKLLKVYGGSEGWVFIEDSAYTLLIETLLEKQSNPSPQDGLIEANLGDGPNGASPAECSNRALLPCSNMQTSDDAPLTNQAVDTVSAASETGGNQLLMEGVDTVSATSETPVKAVDISSVSTEPGNQLSIKAVVETVSATSENGREIPVKPVDISSVTSEPGNLALSEADGPKSQQHVGRFCIKRRRPCYGWISSEDEEEEPTELPPAPLSKVSSMLAK